MDFQEFNTDDLCLFASNLMSKLPDGAVNSIHIYTASNEIEMSLNASQALMATLYKMGPSVHIEVSECGLLTWVGVVPAATYNIQLDLKIYM